MRAAFVCGPFCKSVPGEVFPSGERVLTWGLDWATEWVASTGKKRCVLRGKKLIDVAQIFADGDKVVTGSIDNTVIIWATSICEALHEFTHADWVIGIAVLPNSEAVATATSDGTTTIWSAVTGERLRVLMDGSAPLTEIDGLLPFPQGDLLATFNLEVATIWNATSGEAVHRFPSFPNWIFGLAVSPGGDMLVLCGSDEVTVWDVGKAQRLYELEFESELGHAMAAPASCFAAVGMGNALDPHGFGRGLSWRELSHLAR